MVIIVVKETYVKTNLLLIIKSNKYLYNQTLGLKEHDKPKSTVCLLPHFYSGITLFGFCLYSNLPKGQSLTMFLEVCEACGEMYGSLITHLCLTGPHQKTYKHCLLAMGFER